jgi:hypothetical protein
MDAERLVGSNAPNERDHAAHTPSWAKWTCRVPTDRFPGGTAWQDDAPSLEVKADRRPLRIDGLLPQAQGTVTRADAGIRRRSSPDIGNASQLDRCRLKRSPVAEAECATHMIQALYRIVACKAVDEETTRGACIKLDSEGAIVC